jgi:hypothetical protein
MKKNKKNSKEINMIIALVEESLPEAVKAVKHAKEANAKLILCNIAFGTDMGEVLLFGALIKYAGMMGVDIIIVGEQKTE